MPKINNENPKLLAVDDGNFSPNHINKVIVVNITNNTTNDTPINSTNIINNSNNTIIDDFNNILNQN